MNFDVREPFTVAAVQDSPVFLNLAASVEKAVQLVEQAAGHGARLVVFPETWLPGYPMWLDVAPEAGLWDHPPAKAVFARLFENSPAIPDPALDPLCQIARATQTTIVMGLHERDGGTLYNTMLYIGPDGQLQGKHRKLVPTYTERMVWGRGDGSMLKVIETPVGRVGGLICWEHWMPLARAAMHAQQELVHVAQWPMVKDLHQVASRHYAFEGQCFVIAAGATLRRGDLDLLGLSLFDSIPGQPDDWLMRGGSAIIAPNTEYLAGPVSDQNTILIATVQPQLAIEGRLTLDVDGHYSRPDVFQLHVNTAVQSNVRFQ